MVRQGDIIKLDFNPQSGHEQAGYRSTVVISNDFFNSKVNMTSFFFNFFKHFKRNIKWLCIAMCSSPYCYNTGIRKGEIIRKQ
ncbi:type II toxin-antitoxin system PemK/MazF family toxin [Sedimentibacter hydroxybenzoicus DSM 7310]|uniref:Type II toxin-antitoxin system PemK/MazF family toxin n=1 Tax=Sedimentibacter hydroxybenzoicus DSM 7310 TaxID=1123245 RepID=A0A974BJ67_SEDHY|nr:type II toxin-antitoxin system PemK/MazF family toxin [Sedimentibacter hydroxybenzoicus DSM 7310]